MVKYQGNNNRDISVTLTSFIKIVNEIHTLNYNK